MIGENGLGKTSILNALYYTLNCEFNKLSSIVFEKIILEFQSGKPVEIEHEKLAFYSEDDEVYRAGIFGRIINIFNRIYNDEEKDKIINQINNDEFDELLLRRLYERYPQHYVRKALKRNFSGQRGELENIKKTIKNEVNEKILYFPTYRRIEEELYNLGLKDSEEKPFIDNKNLLIQFGMEDVAKTFDKVLSNIKNSALEGFSSITGKMLTQYVNRLYTVDKNIEMKQLNIILERVGENITDNNKEKIIELVNTGKIFEGKDKYKYLINFLSNLISIYKQQEPADNSIKNFVEVCNRYLIGKNVIYNESKLELYIVETKNNKKIELKKLSSGEKQIISLFTKIYLESSENLIILFDEPELSLSLEWQKQLLPDILKSNKCTLLLGVTHSPFIFDNELDMNAEDMNKYVKEKHVSR